MPFNQEGCSRLCQLLECENAETEHALTRAPECLDDILGLAGYERYDRIFAGVRPNSNKSTDLAERQDLSGF
jgi:hypothetical protein